MKVFISWSGEKSKKLAQVLYSWLPSVIQATKPYFTPNDIEKGTRWHSEVAKELEDSSIGIICLTKTNLQAPWLMFEAGALAKSIDKSRVVPVLFEVEPSELQGPLLQFQATSFNKDDFLILFKTLNSALGDDALRNQILENIFNKWWPEYEKMIQDILNETETSGQKVKPRSDRELIEEILKLARQSSYNLMTPHYRSELFRKTETLKLTKKATNILKTEGIELIGELVQKTEADLFNLPGFNKKYLYEVKELLSELGLSLGMKPEFVPPEMRLDI